MLSEEQAALVAAPDIFVLLGFHGRHYAANKSAVGHNVLDQGMPIGMHMCDVKLQPHRRLSRSSLNFHTLICSAYLICMLLRSRALL